MNYSESNDMTVAVNEIKRNALKENMTNNEKRALHTDIELVLINIDEKLLRLRQTGKTEDPDLKVIKSELMALSASKTKLKLITRPHKHIILRGLDYIDAIIRTVAQWSFMISTAIILAFPCILLRPIDYILVHTGCIKPTHQISNLCKWFIAQYFLKLAGVHLEVDSSEVDHMFGKESALICFTHASSLDAFILSASVPVRFYSLAKSDLFLIPFFSWSLLAFGGLPVNRDNRDQAIKSVSKAAKLAKLGDCVAVAPEGTRSLTGQLLPFKKGPFYLWESLQIPIIPMVTFGAYDLCPPGNQVPLPGKMCVRLLAPIYPHEAASRDEMSILLRRRMVEAIKAAPKDQACELTWGQRAENILLLLVFYSAVICLFTGLWLYVDLKDVLLTIGFDSLWLALLVLLAGSIVITLLVYVWIMYVTYWLEDLFSVLMCKYGGYSSVGTEEDAESRIISGRGSKPAAGYGSTKNTTTTSNSGGNSSRSSSNVRDI